MADTREELLSKPWFGFDLDDTLHEFRKASGAATTVALSHIATQHQILLKDLKAAYKKVLARGTWNSFTDGRTSLQYRKERFANLLEMFYIVPTSEFLDILAARYKTALEQSLEIKPGAAGLLKYLKEKGKKVVVITEGPEDAQKWTLEKLGLIEHVDYLATSNRLGVSKAAGLFPRVLDELQIKGEDLVFVGDSYPRDVVPALAEGIRAVYYAENGGISFKSEPLRITSLETLEIFLKGKGV